MDDAKDRKTAGASADQGTAEIWTLQAAAAKLSDLSLDVQSRDGWLAFLLEKVEAKVLPVVRDRVMSDDVNAVLEESLACAVSHLPICLAKTRTPSQFPDLPFENLRRGSIRSLT